LSQTAPKRDFDINPVQKRLFVCLFVCLLGGVSKRDTTLTMENLGRALN
jgi:hypothetical protein